MQRKHYDATMGGAIGGSGWECDWRGIASVGFLSIIAWLAVIGFGTVLHWFF